MSQDAHIWRILVGASALSVKSRHAVPAAFSLEVTVKGTHEPDGAESPGKAAN